MNSQSALQATPTLDPYAYLFPDEFDAVAVRVDELARQAGVHGMCTEPAPMPFDEEASDQGKAV